MTVSFYFVSTCLSFSGMKIKVVVRDPLQYFLRELADAQCIFLDLI